MRVPAAGAEAVPEPEPSPEPRTQEEYTFQWRAVAHPENYPLLMKSIKERGKEKESRRKKDKNEELLLREKSQGDFIKWLTERTEFVLLGGRQNVTTHNQGTGSAQGRNGSVRKAYGNVCSTEVKVTEGHKA